MTTAQTTTLNRQMHEAKLRCSPLHMTLIGEDRILVCIDGEYNIIDKDGHRLDLEQQIGEDAWTEALGHNGQPSLAD